jgi:hypothetical protein
MTLSPDDFVVLILLRTTSLLLLKMFDLVPTPSCPIWSPPLRNTRVTLTFEELEGFVNIVPLVTVWLQTFVLPAWLRAAVLLLLDLHPLSLIHPPTHSLTYPRNPPHHYHQSPTLRATRHIPGTAKSLTDTLTQAAVAPTTSNSPKPPYTLLHYRYNVTTDHPAASSAPDRPNCSQPERAPDPSSSQSQARAFARSRCHSLALQ